MERKTVNLRDVPEELVRKAKACAALHGMTLKDFVIDAVYRAIQRDIPAAASEVLLGIVRKPKKKR